MMKKRVKEGSALLLALSLVFSALALPGVRAADAVETERLCSVEFSIAGTYGELKEVAGGVPIKLYKVAAIDADGTYTAESAFEGLDLSALEDGEAAADAWRQRAADAAERIKTNTVAAAHETSTDADGKAAVGQIQTGMYLVAADAVQSPYYEYRFTPYLISLPNNYYYTGGSQDDSWVYDLTGDKALSLKPEQTARYGELKINKTVVNHNVTFGGKITVVFEVKITPLTGKETTKIRTLAFDAVGSKSLVIDKIPAGATVQVTEIDPGAGYELTGDSERVQGRVIAAGEPAEVSFENQHDGRLVGGYGVVNNFKLDENGQYNGTALDDNSGSSE